MTCRCSGISVGDHSGYMHYITAKLLLQRYGVDAVTVVKSRLMC